MANETGPDTLDDELDALFGQHVAGGLSRGLVYGRTTADGLVHSTGYGVAGDEGLVPDADTVFPIASITKSFVACAALIARRQGLLSLDEPITTYFPEFSASGTVEDPCDPPTIGMLLSMSGGLTEDNSWVDPFIDATELQLLEQAGKGLRYSHLPGNTFEYSNLGFTLAGLAVGRAVGRPIEEFVREQVFVPLGLTSTYFDNAAPADIVRATGYRYDDDGNWQPFPYTASAAFAAAGGIMSSVKDLATWITWLGSALRPPAIGGDQADVDILSRAARREMQRVHAFGIPALAMAPGGALQPVIGGYGLGLGVYQFLHRGTQVAHSGGLPGFLLHVLWHPDSGNGMVALTNSQRGNAPGLCAQALAKVLTKESSPASTIVLWPETLDLQAKAERLVRDWDESLAGQILADNVDFDRPLTARRAEIAELIGEIGPLTEPRQTVDIVSAASAADITWAIPGERGELICMIHLTPVSPAQIQEIVVRAVPAGTPRSAAPVDISARRAGLGEAFISASTNTRVLLP